MKTILAILLLLFPLPLAAGEPIQLALTTGVQAVVSSGAVAGTTCDSCSGDLALAHHFEDETCDDNTKSVCGCSDNASKDLTLGTGGGIDATISSTTGTGWPSDGTKSLGVGTNDTSIPLTYTKAQGTIIFDLYCSTWGARSQIITIGSSSDGMWITASGSDDNGKVYFWTRSSTDSNFIYVYAPNSSFTGGKRTITARWDTATAHDSNYMQILVDGVDGGASSKRTSSFLEVAGNYSTLLVNNTPTTSNVCYVDNLKVYSSWQ